MITIFDLDSSYPDGKSLSPYACRVRIALNYKNLPHKSTFLSPLALEADSKAHNIPANDTDLKPDGTPGKYTIPAIHDPATGRTITDSLSIIAYLDQTYPGTHQLTTPEGRVAGFAVEDLVLTQIAPHLWPVVTSRALGYMTEEFVQAFKPTYEAGIEMSLEEFLANSEHAEKYLARAKAGFDTLERFFEKSERVAGERGEGPLGPWIGGSRFGYADVVLGGVLLWVSRAMGEESEEWKRLREWNGGRWGRFFDALRPYTVIHL
ncbi:hypothetical protein D9611_000537 [Ephemerocybe angulata]|uniref:GST N-terminal domain-containing protein n=1 Tax=Ephemerocybe angulata TaxID=980116 RepID=A0A8H5BQP3_9AGAR|nr:hypothetical protein D9611_000537 [Tulosesus angulatus]